MKDNYIIELILDNDWIDFFYKIIKNWKILTEKIEDNNSTIEQDVVFWCESDALEYIIQLEWIDYDFDILYSNKKTTKKFLSKKIKGDNKLFVFYNQENMEYKYYFCSNNIIKSSNESLTLEKILFDFINKYLNITVKTI